MLENSQVMYLRILLNTVIWFAFVQRYGTVGLTKKIKGNMNAREYLNHVRKNAHNTRQQGYWFEKSVRALLLNGALYGGVFADVWLWDEYPYRDGRGDTGVDIVAKHQDGSMWAVQCKCFAEETSLDRGDVAPFLANLGTNDFDAGLFIATTDGITATAAKAFENRDKPVQLIGLSDLLTAVKEIDFGPDGHFAVKKEPRKTLRPHQRAAFDAVVAGLQNADRGKLIMACGTGKTFTSLKLAEHLAGAQGTVLFLAPSIALVNQTLKEWKTESEIPLAPIPVCSDAQVGRDDEDISAHDLPFTATTDPQQIYDNVRKYESRDVMRVVFSTYQSIERVKEAQAIGLPEFDLIICDEAHRTTGVTLAGQDESHFVRAHDNDFIKAKKRLYMTATPRIYKADLQIEAKDVHDATVASMDDPTLYGKELHCLRFDEAVEMGLLADYKVLILTVNEGHVSHALQRLLESDDKSLTLDDSVKVIGCWNGLAKNAPQGAQAESFTGDPLPMKRAVAFTGTINMSKNIRDNFGKYVDSYKDFYNASAGDEDKEAAREETEGWLKVKVEHVDGTQSALERNRHLNWLKDEIPNGECRILSNARCLSEGVDVPALDAVIFLNPRRSIVDVVQSVGRVMRRAEGKKYGYVILPVGIPSYADADAILGDDKSRYKVVWEVLNALRSHDSRIEAEVNKIDLNDKPPQNPNIIGAPPQVWDDDTTERIDKEIQEGAQKTLPFAEVSGAIYAEMVKRVGTRRYWESWSKDVAEIAQKHIERIGALLKTGDRAYTEPFDTFHKELRQSLNPAVDREDAIEMLAQHIITRPVFDAMFGDYEFAEHNQISKAMQAIVDKLDASNALKYENDSLDRFFATVAARVRGVDNSAGRQKILIDLYEKFFKTAFPRDTEKYGIVYSPVEVVDFIIRSVNDALAAEFGKTLSDEGVHILEPFAGTGTFITQLMRSGLIKDGDLPRKYRKELHINEILLLAYYIATVNIEQTYLAQTGNYVPFPGAVLTDTFQMTENWNDDENGYGDLFTSTDMLKHNSEDALNQLRTKIEVIFTNPPYSVGQRNQNDNNQNVGYPNLDAKIRETYAKHSSAQLARNLYDSYVRAIRWASDRIKDRGVVGIVTNGSFIDSNNMDGLRKCLTDDFSRIYVFNLRGNQRMQGETSRKEGGKIFGSGSRAPVAITIMIKNPDKANQPCELLYYDIGDYLTQKEKLDKIVAFGSIGNSEMNWTRIQPNQHHEWINQRDDSFEQFTVLGDKDGKEEGAIFSIYSLGIVTSRDAWVCNFSKNTILDNVGKTSTFYNSELERLINEDLNTKNIDQYVNQNQNMISWSRGLKNKLIQKKKLELSSDNLTLLSYRPYCIQNLYLSTDRFLNEEVSKIPVFFPRNKAANLCFSVTGRGATKDFSVLMVDSIPDLELISKGQNFPLYYYERTNPDAPEAEAEYERRDAVTDYALAKFQRMLGDDSISKEDIFYYVYGLLHSPEYRDRFANNLKRELPRIPVSANFWQFMQAGRDLAHWHLNYETIEPYPLTEVLSDNAPADEMQRYRVKKMKFGKRGREKDKSVIIYNEYLSLAEIPAEAYEYVVNGRPALEWLIDRYQIRTDRASGIVNDPNDWRAEHNAPRYIVDLVKRVTRVSLETVEIVKKLPAM